MGIFINYIPIGYIPVFLLILPLYKTKFGVSGDISTPFNT